MFTKGRKDGTFRFAIKPVANVKKVALAGDFNGWKLAAMKKQKDGVYAVTVSLEPGTYEYKFVIDGQWVDDPDNPTYALNPYGTVNSVALVE